MVLSTDLVTASSEGDISFTTFNALRNHFFSKTEGSLLVTIEPLKDCKFSLKAWAETAEKTMTFCEQEIWKGLQNVAAYSEISSFEEWHRLFLLSPISFRLGAKSHQRVLGLLDDREKLFDCARLCKGLYSSVNQEGEEKKDLTREPKKAIVVRDKDKRVQALGLFSFEASHSGYCTLTHIVSAPQNIKMSVIKDENAVRGAGRAVLVRAIFMTIEKQLATEKMPEILLRAAEVYRPSRGFYSSCGMHLIGDDFAFTSKEAKGLLENEKLHPVKCIDQSKEHA